MLRPGVTSLFTLHPGKLSPKLSSSSAIKNFHYFLPNPVQCARFSVSTANSLSSFKSSWDSESFRTTCVRKLSVSQRFLLNNERYKTPNFHYSRSLFSSSNSSTHQATEGELQLKDTIRKCFPNATNIIVEDVSGGCGSMYLVFIEAPEFKGLSIVKQHLLVNQALKQEIKSMHGIRIQTAASKTS